MNKKEFTQGFKDGIPIGLGYFAVSFALGIAMKNAKETAKYPSPIGMPSLKPCVNSFLFMKIII